MTKNGKKELEVGTAAVKTWVATAARHSAGICLAQTEQPPCQKRLAACIQTAGCQCEVQHARTCT